MAKKVVKNLLDDKLEKFKELYLNKHLKDDDIKLFEKILNPFLLKETESNKIKILIFFYNVYRKYNLIEKFEQNVQVILPMLLKRREYERLGKVYQDLGIHYRILGNYSLSLEYIRKSLDIYERSGESIKIGDLLNSLGNYYYEIGEFSLAIEHYHKALENLKLYQNSEEYHVAKGNLAELYKSLNYFQKAKDLLTRDIENLKLENNFFHYAKSLQGISEIYLEEGRNKLAYKYCKQAIENWEKVDSPLHMSSVYATLGSILSRFEKYDEAIEYYEKSKAILEKFSYRYEIIKLQYLFGTTYLDLKNYKKAVNHLEEAEEIALKINQRIELRRIYNSLYKAYEGAGNNAKAYETIKKLTHLNDTMFNFSLQAKVNEVQVNFELEKKEIEYSKEREINEYKNNLFSYITHEFRTPLTLINTPLEMLADETDIRVIKTKISSITTNVVHMQHLLDQLLDINKIEEGKMPILKKAGSINPLLWHVIHLFEPEMSDRNIDFSYNMPKKNIQAYFDTDKIEKIISNLLSNAIKYSKEGGKIQFNANYDKSNLILEVKDNGIGIDKKYQGEIFNKFYRIPSTSDVKGSGLGLSFVKELVTLLKGTIELESTPNQGTKFTVILPIERIEKHIKEEKIIDEDDSTKPKLRTLLIVEDNYEILKLLREVFSDHYKVYTADHGRDAIQKIKKNIPDLVISDIMMPLMNGIELCQYIKQDDDLNHIPVILLTAKSQVSDRIEGLESGADAYLTKPFNINELKQTVESILNQRKKIMDRFSSNVLKINNEELTSADSVFIKIATEFVLNNIENENLSVNDLARHLNMSRFTLIRKFKKINDSTPNFFIQKIRLEKAKELIKNKVANVTEIAFKVGFGSTTYFSYSFKKEFGMTPKEFYHAED